MGPTAEMRGTPAREEGMPSSRAGVQSFLITWVATFISAVAVGAFVERVVKPAPLTATGHVLSFVSSAAVAGVATVVSWWLVRDFSPLGTVGRDRAPAAYATALSLFIGGSWPFTVAAQSLSTVVRGLEQAGALIVLGAVGFASAVSAGGTQFFWRLAARGRKELTRPGPLLVLVVVAALLALAAAARAGVAAGEALQLAHLLEEGEGTAAAVSAVAWSLGLDITLASAALWGALAVCVGFVRGLGRDGVDDDAAGMGQAIGEDPA